jgi:hypothetical protein
MSTRMRGSSRMIAMLVMTILSLWVMPIRAQTWTYKRETDVMTDRTNHFASVRFGNRHLPMTFYAACRDGDLEMWFAPHDFIGASDVNGPHARAGAFGSSEESFTEATAYAALLAVWISGVDAPAIGRALSAVPMSQARCDSLVSKL